MSEVKQLITGAIIMVHRCGRMIAREGADVLAYLEFLEIENHLCRIIIRSDVKISSSQAVGEVWSPNELKWNQVTYIPWSLMKTQTRLAFSPLSHEGDFESDATTLQDSIKMILSYARVVSPTYARVTER